MEVTIMNGNKTVNGIPPDASAAAVSAEPETPINALDALLNSDKDAKTEYERRFNKAIDERRAKWERDEAARVEAAKTEAERLAKMNAEQRAEHERKEREETLARRERELTLREMRATAGDELARRGLPSALLSGLDYSGADNCGASIDAIEKAWRDSVQERVEERLRGTPPKTGTGKPANSHMAAMREAMGLK
jgi:hypothetical protein